MDIYVDFMEGLANSKGKTTILVVDDRLSKFTHFIHIRHPYRVVRIAHVFFSHSYKLYGLPTSIVCDRDPVFTRTFWKELF